MKEQTLPATTAAPSSDAQVVTRPRRRVPSLALGLGGAIVTVIYGIAVMRLRFGPPLVMLGLGGLTLVLSGIALWRMLDPLSRAELPTPAAPRARGRLRELEREKQLVLKAIKEIEFDYQMRKIAEPDYKEMIERYRGRALRVMSELEAGDNFRPLIERELRERLARESAVETASDGAATAGDDAKPSAPVTAAGTCKTCDTRNDEDAQFCKKCGAKLASS